MMSCKEIFVDSEGKFTQSVHGFVGIITEEMTIIVSFHVEWENRPRETGKRLKRLEMAEFGRLQGVLGLEKGDFWQKILRGIEKFFGWILGDFLGSGALAAGGEKGF